MLYVYPLGHRVQDAWNVTLRRDTCMTSSGTIGIVATPFPNGDVSGPLQFLEQHLLDLPDDSPVATSAVWEPADSKIASLQLGGVIVPILITAPWDGSLGGRTHTILRFTARRCLSTFRDVLQGYNVLRDVVNECLCPPPPVDEDCPRIPLSRCRDNIYIALNKIPPVLQHDARTAVRALLKAIYNIDLEWEMHSNITTWGEGQVVCTKDRLQPTRKGTALGPNEIPEECSRWVDVASTNSRLVWRSFFPSLLQKCLWYAMTGDNIWSNVTSVLVSLVHKHYPVGWWRPTLLRWFEKYHLDRIFSWRKLMILLHG